MKYTELYNKAIVLKEDDVLLVRRNDYPQSIVIPTVGYAVVSYGTWVGDTESFDETLTRYLRWSDSGYLAFIRGEVQVNLGFASVYATKEYALGYCRGAIDNDGYCFVLDIAKGKRIEP